MEQKHTTFQKHLVSETLCDGRVRRRRKSWRMRVIGVMWNRCQELTCYKGCVLAVLFSVDKKNQLDVTFCILYFSSNSCSTCFGQPCAHHQELTTAWSYSLVLVCAVVVKSGWQVVRPYGRTTCQPYLTTSLQPRHIPTRVYNIT